MEVKFKISRSCFVCGEEHDKGCPCPYAIKAIKEEFPISEYKQSLIQWLEGEIRDQGEKSKCKYCGEVKGSPDCGCATHNETIDKVINHLKEQ